MGWEPSGFDQAGWQPEGWQPAAPAVEPERLTIRVNSGLIPIKDPDDELLLTFDWSDVLDDGVTLSSVTHAVVAHTSTPPLVASDEETDQAEGTSDVDLSGGVHGALYTLTLVATLSDASTVTRRWPVRGFNS